MPEVTSELRRLLVAMPRSSRNSFEILGKTLVLLLRRCDSRVAPETADCTMYQAALRPSSCGPASGIGGMRPTKASYVFAALFNACISSSSAARLFDTLQTIEA